MNKPYRNFIWAVKVLASCKTYTQIGVGERLCHLAWDQIKDNHKDEGGWMTSEGAKIWDHFNNTLKEVKRNLTVRVNKIERGHP